MVAQSIHYYVKHLAEISNRHSPRLLKAIRLPGYGSSPLEFGDFREIRPAPRNVGPVLFLIPLVFPFQAAYSYRSASAG